MIEVSHLTKKYGENLAVDDISFTVEPGKIYGFLGPNGAGKSTTMNIITGCLAPTSGEVTVNGYSIVEEPIEAKSYIGYLPELPPLYTDMTPYEYLRFVAECKGVKRSEIEEELDYVMEETAIYDVKDRLIRNLSKGYRQRVGIAQAMIGDPEVIILDEPTVGLDPQQIIEIRDLIKSLGEENRTVILSSHILTEVASVCDRILVISHGKIVANDTMENISSSMKSETIMDITVKASSETVALVLGKIPEITSYEITETDGTVSKVKLRYPTDADLRETVFFAFSDERCAIMESTVEEESLEEIFLKLTGSDESEKKDREHAGASDDENDDEDADVEWDDDEYDEEDDDEDEDDEYDDDEDDGEDDE
ncbi:MAG: ABC transporter ATP-binding protein [Firmicutes bacterium]|nr:ABC transporter ATP-binding protein [Bacillota bacterium]MCD7831975.1 ABC transporter ATP-binding protein [Bacillota bacterium]